MACMLVSGVYYLRPAVTLQVDLLVIQGFPKLRFQTHFVDKMERCCTVLANNVNESPETIMIQTVKPALSDRY
jgi:hypothetical protein